MNKYKNAGKIEHPCEVCINHIKLRTFKILNRLIK
jgi:hypothetical protein